MAPTVPTAEPTTATAGETWRWTRDLSEFPATEGWTLSYHLTGPSATPSVAVTTVGSGFDVRVAPAATAQLEAGTYTLIGRVTDGSDVFEVYRGPLQVLADPASSVPTVSHTERMIAALEAAELTLATQPRARVEINDRTVEFRSLQEVRESLAFYRRQLQVEQTGTLAGPSMAVTFRSAR